MDENFTLGILAVGIMISGYAFKKSWLLWFACIFWVALGVNMAYNETWFPDAAQKSLILVGFLGTIGCIYGATRKQLVTLTDENSAIDDEEMDDEDKEYFKEVARHKKTSGMYHTKTKTRKSPYRI